MDFGQRLQQARRQEQMSQQALAEQLYVSRQTISHWERGINYPDFASLLRLAEIFSLSLDQLLREDHQMKQSFTKKTIREFLKPVYRQLVFSQLCFSLVLLLEAAGIIRLQIWGFVPVVIGQLTVILALRHLRRVDQKYRFQLHYRWQEKVRDFLKTGQENK